MKAIQKQIEIMQHFANGGKIEICKNNKWSDITNPEFKDWNFAIYGFRIKKQKNTITIEKWLCKDGNGSYYISEGSDISGYGKVKLLESYEVEL